MQQTTGINALLVYSTVIFKEAYSHTWAEVFTLLVGIVNCLSVLLSMFTVDKLGRKTLTTIGAFGLFLC
jgi:SP family arabinose:H+ symporter-like MFS transporter